MITHRDYALEEVNKLTRGERYEHISTNFRRRLNKLIKERDGYMCKNCGSNKLLIVHHKDMNYRNDNLNNLITLCRSCHVRLHNGK